MDLSAREYSALRDTIRARGTARLLAALLGVSLWAVALLVTLAWLPNPIVSVVPLMVLWTTFEVVRTLHLGVERIGRYLQVFYEEREVSGATLEPPAWERAAMGLSSKVPGAGGHPLFMTVFLLGGGVNLLSVILPAPLPVELALLGVPHAAFAAWILFCDRRMRLQRAAELARFRALKAPHNSASP
ncbi:MAG: hypothetical protein ACT4QD_22850 [Acidobacteriota bacterium]